MDPVEVLNLLDAKLGKVLKEEEDWRSRWEWEDTLIDEVLLIEFHIVNTVRYGQSVRLPREVLESPALVGVWLDKMIDNLVKSYPILLNDEALLVWGRNEAARVSYNNSRKVAA